MSINEEQFQMIKELIETEGKKIYDEIKSKYGNYLSDKKKKNDLIEFGGDIIVNAPSEEDEILFKGKKNVPLGHGGRRKMDNKIHIYPYSPQLLGDVDNIKELIYTLINDVVIHENFHFYAQPDIYDKNEENYKKYGDDVWFGHSLTEGIVQYFTEIYIDEHNLDKSKSNYRGEVLLVEKIVDDLQSESHKSM